MFYISRTSHWIFVILTASSLDWNFQSILHFFGIFRWKFGDCQILGQNFSYYRLRAPLIWLRFCNFDRSSNAFMAFSDTAPTVTFLLLHNPRRCFTSKSFPIRIYKPPWAVDDFWMTSFGQLEIGVELYSWSVRMDQGRVWADFGAQICCDCAALLGLCPPGMVTCKILDFFSGLSACNILYLCIWMDSTLHKEAIGEFFVILGAKTGVLPNFWVKILNLPISGDRLVEKKYTI